LTNPTPSHTLRFPSLILEWAHQNQQYNRMHPLRKDARAGMDAPVKPDPEGSYRVFFTPAVSELL